MGGPAHPQDQPEVCLPLQPIPCTRTPDSWEEGEEILGKLGRFLQAKGAVLDYKEYCGLSDWGVLVLQT